MFNQDKFIYQMYFQGEYVGMVGEICRVKFTKKFVTLGTVYVYNGKYYITTNSFNDEDVKLIDSDGNKINFVLASNEMYKETTPVNTPNSLFNLDSFVNSIRSGKVEKEEYGYIYFTVIKDLCIVKIKVDSDTKFDIISDDSVVLYRNLYLPSNKDYNNFCHDFKDGDYFGLGYIISLNLSIFLQENEFILDDLNEYNNYNGSMIFPDKYNQLKESGTLFLVPYVRECVKNNYNKFTITSIEGTSLTINNYLFNYFNTMIEILGKDMRTRCVTTDIISSIYNMRIMLASNNLLDYLSYKGILSEPIEFKKPSMFPKEVSFYLTRKQYNAINGNKR